MKTAFLNFRNCVNNDPTEENFKNVGINSGNIVFSQSLKTTIRCEALDSTELIRRAKEFDKLVVRDFITISEDADLSWFDRIMNLFRDKSIIPISVGLQSPDMNPKFKLHPHAVKTLKEVSERAILGVRGEYSASILNKHGIKNIRVVGCPSLFYGADYSRRIEKKSFCDVKRVVSNYQTIDNKLNNPTDISLIDYLSKHAEAFVEQTKCYANDEFRNGTLKPYTQFLIKDRKYFFIFEDWYKYMQQFDFCIGGRFHGNVMALLSGVPALFLTSDSRTTEMTDFFELPTVKTTDFDVSKPLEYYYEMADYTNFNKNYPKKLDNFIDFCLSNHLELNYGVQQFTYRKYMSLAAAESKIKEKQAQLDQCVERIIATEERSLMSKIAKLIKKK